MAPTELSGAIERFCCCQNHDIERFLKHNAIDFERRGYSTTYLYVDLDTFDIAGYFSLTHKALSIEGFSKEKKKDLTGSKKAELAPFILLGQLGKYKRLEEDGTITSSPLSGDRMMKDVFSIIALANQYILNRRILVECDEEEHLLSFYIDGHKFRMLECEDHKCTLYLKLEAPDL